MPRDMRVKKPEGEARPGGKEDLELELEFRRIVAGDHYLQRRGSEMPCFEIQFVPKLANSCGLQLADLIAPDSLRILRGHQPNRAFEIIQRKIWRGPDGQSSWYGLKFSLEKRKAPVNRGQTPTGNEPQST